VAPAVLAFVAKNISPMADLMAAMAAMAVVYISAVKKA
jgi:hypothetical protein